MLSCPTLPNLPFFRIDSSSLNFRFPNSHTAPIKIDIGMRSRLTSYHGGGGISETSSIRRQSAKIRMTKQRRTGPFALPFHSKEVAKLYRFSQPPWLVFLSFCGLGLIGFWMFMHATDTAQFTTDSGYGHPSITIFTSPTPFISSSSSSLPSYIGSRQELAVRSWLALSPNITVVLFSNHPSIKAFARSLGSRVSVESNIDFTFLGTPFFHSMMAESQFFNSSVSVLIDPQIVLFSDFLSTIYEASKLDVDWFLVSSSTNVSHLPFHLNVTLKALLHKSGPKANLGKLREFLLQTRHYPNSCDGNKGILAWNSGGAPLHAGVLPPFLYGKGIHNQWIVNEVLASEFRLVIDASATISSFYMDDNPSRLFVTGLLDSWENNCNSYIGSVYGSLYFRDQMIDREKRIIRLGNCGGHFFFQFPLDEKMEGVQMTNKEWEHAGFVRRTFLPSKLMKLQSYCMDEENKCWITKQQPKKLVSKSLVLPFSLNQLLKMVADENRSIVLAVAGNSYRDMLMSWVCRLRHLSVRNFVINALDAETYHFSVLQGLPVFMDPLAPRNISYDNCHFGSDCFLNVTKVKSRLVLQILKLGYNVLLSDVDVYWFRNPLPFLHSFGPSVLVVQSDEYKETGPINLPRRLNSGFYYIQSSTTAIAAMKKVVKHASMSELSEQPSFYDVLCGVGGVNRVGNNGCIETDTNLTVHFLDRNMFPNGAYQDLWQKKDVGIACRRKGCVILHNNWISGRERKLDRQVLSGLWAYDSTTRKCRRRQH